MHTSRELLKLVISRMFHSLLPSDINVFFVRTSRVTSLILQRIMGHVSTYNHDEPYIRIIIIVAQQLTLREVAELQAHLDDGEVTAKK